MERRTKRNGRADSLNLPTPRPPPQALKPKFCEWRQVAMQNDECSDKPRHPKPKPPFSPIRTVKHVTKHSPKLWSSTVLRVHSRVFGVYTWFRFSGLWFLKPTKQKETSRSLRAARLSKDASRSPTPPPGGKGSGYPRPPIYPTKYPLSRTLGGSMTGPLGCPGMVGGLMNIGYLFFVHVSTCS